MDEDDDHSTLQSFTQLITDYPDLNMTLVADVLQQCDHDYQTAYNILCEMVIPPEPTTHHPSHQTVPQHHRIPDQTVPKVPSPPHQIHYAYPPTATSHPPEYHSIFEPASAHHSTPHLDNPDPIPSSPPKRTPQGAWAHKSMGRKYRVDHMCNRYQWIARSVVEDLFDKYHDCVQLVEDDILNMFPVDEPQAYAPSQHHTSHLPSRPTSAPSTPQSSHRRRSSPHQQAMAESLRQQAADQIRRDARSQEIIYQSSKGMDILRRQLWETRQTRTRLHHLANQTRKASHVSLAKDKDAELRRLSELFLERMRRSEEYRGGVIDLHGLTKEESLQLVEWKLAENGRRRFRVITGKGRHSHNGQAVLRPALEKFFQSRGVSYSMQDDAVMSVLP